MTRSESADLLTAFDYVWQRFSARMTGLDDAEWQWQPGPDDRLSLRWRVAHIAGLLAMERNAGWLEAPASPAPGPDLPPDEPRVDLPGDPAEALAGAEAAYAWWRDVLATQEDAELARPMGPVAGPYTGWSRRSFVLHVLDELVHHSAEAALLRDLWASRTET